MIALGKVEVGNSTAKLTLSPNSLASNSAGARHYFPAIGAEATILDGHNQAFLPAISTFEGEEELIEPICLKEHTEYDFTLVLKESEGDVLSKRTANPAYPFHAAKLKQFVTFNSPDACYTQADGRYRLTGRINFLGYAGKADLSLVEELNLKFVVDVLPAKFHYLSEFKSLLEQLSDIHAELILKLDGATEALLNNSESSEPSEQILIIHLRRLFRPEFLPDSVSAILNNPHHKYTALTKVEPLAFVTNPNMVGIAVNHRECDWNKGGSLAGVFNGFTPQSLPSNNLNKSFDTPENRFIKSSLKDLSGKIADLDSRIPNCYTGTKTSLSRWKLLLTGILSQAIWREVKDSSVIPNSMVLQNRIGYRGFRQQLLTFNLGLSLNSTVGEFNPATGDLNPVYELYELWCYFQLRASLEQACNSEGEPKVEHSISESGYKVNLRKGSKSAVIYQVRHLGKPIDVRFFYNRTFEKVDDGWAESYTARFHPDFSMEFTCEGLRHWIHFDAKYKLTHKDWADSLAGDANSVHGYKTADLQTAHSYRDALLGTRGSFILYPGSAPAPDLHVRHSDPAYRAAVAGPGVGAFALCPSKNPEAGRVQITNYLFQLMDAIAKHKGYDEEQGFDL